MNLYGYLGGNPRSWVDPLGLREVDCRACGNCKGKKDAKDIVDEQIKGRIRTLTAWNIKAGDLPEGLYEQFGKGVYVTDIEKWIAQQADYYAPPDPKLPYKYTGSGLENAGCVLLCGECVGIDKLGHFFQQGWQYYQISVINNTGDAAAEKFGQYTEGIGKAGDYTKEEQGSYKKILGLLLGTIGFGVYGSTTSGVISYADLAANKAGLQFYKDVAAGKFESICKYVTADWDEVKNPNKYAEWLIIKIFRNTWTPLLF
jgi:hypothetical protein